MSLAKNRQTYKYKKRQIAQLKYGWAIILLCALFLPSYSKLQSTGVNTYEVYLNDTYVGKLDSTDVAENCLIEARRKLAASSDELVLTEAHITYKESEELYGTVDSPATVTEQMRSTLASNVKETLARAYTLKIGQYTVNLSSTDDVIVLLQAALDKYQETKQFEPVLNLDPERELSVLCPTVVEVENTTQKEETFNIFTDCDAGIESFLDEVYAEIEPDKELDFDDYEQGLMAMGFDDDIEVVECYLPASEIEDLQSAIRDVTQDEAKPTIYEVVSGDTLSQIAEKVDIPMDDLIAMNDSLENENTMIHIGDEITITVPQPKLSVRRLEQLYYEEDYEAEIQYVDNDEWYTTDKVTLQEPSAGHHNVMAQIEYRNDSQENVVYLKEEVTYEAVAKIVERGTKIPPSYIKPISGGRLTSNFGYRKRPTKGASTYHKGVDWATPTGTAVVASSGGVVTKAGWGSGYGYVVYIQHPDGKVTRYGHLSKILVSAGQSVSQGQKIALSGNTGVSTGPHLHFEILINGSQVNPLNYLN